jgi:SAM-dependent methyltransferase
MVVPLFYLIPLEKEGESKDKMAEHVNLYQHAVYYDIALSRDVSGDVDFLADVYRHYVGSEVRSVLDIACGPGYHALEFARRGVDAAGLDLRAEMVALAEAKAAEEGLSVDYFVGDMRAFDLAQPVDMAICMFDSIDALLTNDDLIDHMRCVAENLTPGGIYVIDLTHLRDCSFDSYGSFRYGGSRGPVSVEIVWATNDPAFDTLTGVAEVELELHVTENGTQKVIKDTARERLLTPQEILLLARLSGALEVVGWHGAYDIDQPLDDSPDSTRLICILQKTDQSL